MFKKLFGGLKEKIVSIVKGYPKIDDELFDNLEEILILSDMSALTAIQIKEDLKQKVKERKIEDPEEIKDLLKEELVNILSSFESPVLTYPSALLVVGVNGVGKTTSIAKIANFYNKEKSKTVLLCAGDTFRAAAVEQLKMWSERINLPIVYKEQGVDPASVLFDGISEAKKENIDILICDTSGRLQNKENLMKELEKMSRILNTKYTEAKIETLLVLDGTTGQNAILQAEAFQKSSPLTGLIITKLDSTARAGFVFDIQKKLGVPIWFVCSGEKIEDVALFDKKSFVDAIFE